MYYVISGQGLVSVEGNKYVVRKGSVVFIPGDAEHGVCNTGVGDLVWLYIFAASGFGEIVYQFSEQKSTQTEKELKAKL